VPKKLYGQAATGEEGDVPFTLFALGGSWLQFTASGTSSISLTSMTAPSGANVPVYATAKGWSLKTGPIRLPESGTYEMLFHSASGAGVTVSIAAGLKGPKANRDWIPEENLRARASISGSVSVGAPAQTKAKLGRRPTAAAEHEPGEVLVKLAAGDFDGLVADHPALRLETADSMEDMGWARLALREDWRTRVGPGGRLRATERALERLGADPRVAKVERNDIARAARAPNDPMYTSQWHYDAINLEEAWDVTVGSASVVVAVIDSGIVDHEDLNDNVLPGYDFVSNATSAGDGDGPDSDPTAIDEMHGVHVAGTVAAVSNNRVGVAGVAWQAKILPVRVLGKDGSGSYYDIAKGIRYAAGISGSGIPANPNPARVINLSLGGPGNTSILSEAIDEAVAAGVLVVAAAGNNASSAPFYPAAYPNVVSVSSVGPTLALASYSNYGTTVDIAAPGGDMTNYGSDAGVLSTFKGTSGQLYSRLHGTSMASPHVAGVAALVISANPALTVAEVRSILLSTTHDLGATGNDIYYGAGLVDAGKAVRVAAPSPPPPPPEPEILVSPTMLTFGSGTFAGSIVLKNLGGGTITVSSVQTVTDSGEAWLSATPDGTTAPMRVEVVADPVGLADGQYRGRVEFGTSAGPATVEVVLTVEAAPDLGSVNVYLFDSAGHLVDSTVTSAAQGYAFTFDELTAGGYGIVATAGYALGEYSRLTDYYGEWPVVGDGRQVEVGADGQDVTGVDFPLVRLDSQVDLPGVGAGPIDGALVVKVTDQATGGPLEGALVSIGDGTYSRLTDYQGRATLTGAFAGAQTVTVSAGGYQWQTYSAMNAQFMSVPLLPTSGPDDFVTVDVRVKNLLSYEYYGIVSVADDWQVYYYDGFNDPIVTVSVPRGVSEIPVSVLAYDDPNMLSSYALDWMGPFTTSGSTVELWTEWPDGIWYTSVPGSVTLPTGNFNLVGAQTFMDVTAWDDPEFPILLGFSLPTSVSNYYLEWLSFGDPLDDGITASQKYGALDGDGAMTAHYVRSWLSSLPNGRPVDLMDVPALVSPGDGATTTSLWPTLTFGGVSGADLLALTAEEEGTGRLWEVLFDPAGGALPVLPSSFFRKGYDYTWKVAAYGLPVFEYDNFRWDHLDATAGDLAVTPKRSLLVR
jgi:subtilisin family serine protease